MPAFISIFLLPLDPPQVASLDGVEAAEEAVSRAHEGAPERSGLRIATSTNWWHSVLASELCRAWQIGGLEFLEQEFLVLSVSEARAGRRGCDTLLQHLQHEPLPLLSRPFGSELDALKNADRAAAAEAATPGYEVDEVSGDVHSFFQFLVTVRQALSEAAETGRHLLFLAPHA